jgi:hypothetical protein
MGLHGLLQGQLYLYLYQEETDKSSVLFKICLIGIDVWPKNTLTQLSLLGHIAEETSRSCMGSDS